MKRRSGFTLIELLVVIAIIALLVSILMPSLKKARDLAKAAACSSSLRNVHVAFLSYAGDFNGIVPNGQLAPKFFATTAPDNMFTSWVHYVVPRLSPVTTLEGVQLAGYGGWIPPRSYGDNMNIYCAAWSISWNFAGEFNNNVDDGHYGVNLLPTFGVNGIVPSWAREYVYNSTNGTRPRFLDIMSVPYASETYFMGDVRRDQVLNITYLSKASGEVTNAVGLRHMGDMNMAYLDGHVVKTKYSQIPYCTLGSAPAVTAYEKRPWFALPGMTTMP